MVNVIPYDVFIKTSPTNYVGEFLVKTRLGDIYKDTIYSFGRSTSGYTYFNYFKDDKLRSESIYSNDGVIEKINIYDPNSKTVGLETFNGQVHHIIDFYAKDDNRGIVTYVDGTIRKDLLQVRRSEIWDNDSLFSVEEYKKDGTCKSLIIKENGVLVTKISHTDYPKVIVKYDGEKEYEYNYTTYNLRKELTKSSDSTYLIEYYPDGSVFLTSHYKDSRLYGVYSKYNEYGEIIQDFNYTNDFQDGEQKKCYNSSCIESITNYRMNDTLSANIPIGEHYYYYSSGQLKEIIKYDNDGNILSDEKFTIGGNCET